ncbi:recombinase family protein [Polynucleobacter sp. MWH-Mekk-B1]|uniref:recombinase family protein n=1 Tax=Polynucleobacter finlandensis TaxID=1855894 RepID=UPI001C0E5750|nr:recombinase family protein [Polynucleobacter finlandensis]MBU3545452.1 recombinase family protein [Polynucleobacter finlandensis]
MIKYITYIRVSTQEQGRSGLGLEAQTRDIDTYLQNFSGQPYMVIKEFVEVLSGSDDSRPELFKAVNLARKEKAVLLVAKLDRLSRKVSYIATLMDDKTVRFRVANLPQADNFQLHIYAALAEQERAFISQRTKAALAVAKSNGVKLGGLRANTALLNQVRSDKALGFARSIKKLLVPMVKQKMSLGGIATALNEAGRPTVRGGKWTSTQVSRVLERLEFNKPIL